MTGTELDEKKVEQTCWLGRPDGWMINRKTKKIVLLEYKRTSDTSERYYEVMKEVVEKQHRSILSGLCVLTEDRGWEVEVMPLVTGQRSVRETE